MIQTFSYVMIIYYGSRQTKKKMRFKLLRFNWFYCSSFKLITDLNFKILELSDEILNGNLIRLLVDL